MKLIKLAIPLILVAMKLAAQKPLPQLLSDLQNSREDTNRVLMYKSIANHYLYITPDSAAIFAQKGLDLATALNYAGGIASMNNILGVLNMNQGKMANAQKHLTTALKIFKEVKNAKGIASAENGLGILAARQGEYKEATERFLRALNIFQSLNELGGIVEAYIKLGSVNEQTNNLDKALEYFSKGAELEKTKPVSYETVTLLNDIGIIYLKKNNMPMALKYLRDGLEKTKTPNLVDVRVLLLINISGVYQTLGDIKKAFAYQNEALPLVRKLGLKEQEVNVLTALASLEVKLNPDSSAVLLKQALSIAKAINQQYLMPGIYQGMVDVYKQQGDYKKAEEALEIRNKLKDSLFTLDKTKEIADLQSNYDLANEKLKVQQLQLANGHIRLRQYIVVAIAVAVLLVLLVITIFYTRTRDLNKELTRQKDDLKKLNSFKDKLLSIIGHDLRTPVASILSLMDAIDEEMISAEEAQEFLPTLREQSQVTLEILDKLLLWGKSQLKGINSDKSTLNARKLIEKNLLLFNNAAAQKSITMEDHTQGNITVYADATQVDFVIRNLLANAIKYTRSGGKVEIFNEPYQSIGFQTIIVKDNGIGIADGLQQQIFEPYNKSMEGTASEVGNSIGLMLCKEFIENNDGKIEVVSKLGQGTQFSISLPEA